MHISQKLESAKFLFILIIIALFVVCMVLFPNILIVNAAEDFVAAPMVTEAKTTTDGDRVIIIFDKALTTPGEAPAGFAVKVNDIDDPISSVRLTTDDSRIVELALANPVASYDATVKLCYTPGTVTALDGGVLSSFIDYDVSNQVSESTIVLASALDTRVSAYLTVVNSDNTSTTGEVITGDTLVPLNPMIKLQFSNNVVTNASHNIGCISLLDNNNEPVEDINVFTLGIGDRNDPEKTNIFIQPRTHLLPNSTYTIAISSGVTFKSGEALGEPAVEIAFTTAAALPAVTMESVVLSGQTLVLKGLLSGGELEYRIVTERTTGDWTPLSYTGTTASIDATSLDIVTGVSQVEVRNKDGTVVGKTVYIAIDGESATMGNGKTMFFEDKVTVTPENLDAAATNKISLKRYVLPNKVPCHITPVGSAYEVYLKGAGDNKKVTLSFPVDPSLDINQMSVYILNKSLDNTLDKSDPSKWRLQYLVPDRSQADKHIISIDIAEFDTAGETNTYQVFYDNISPHPVAITALPTVEGQKVVFSQIQAYDNDFISKIEIYRDDVLIGTIASEGYGCWTFEDSDPDLKIGQIYTYTIKAYDRMGNSSWQNFDATKVLFDSNENAVERARLELENGTIPIIYADGDSADHVVTNIHLPRSVPWDENITIKWTTSDPNTIGVYGQVLKSADGSDKYVTLTATIKRGTVTATVAKKLRVTWEPWTNGVMPVRTTYRPDDGGVIQDTIDTMYEFWRALDQDNINTIIVNGTVYDGAFPNNILDAKGKTLVVKYGSFMNQSNTGIMMIIKNAVIDANESYHDSPYSYLALGNQRGGLIFENVEFKGTENLEYVIQSQGGSLVLNNCRFGSTKIAPVFIKQPDAGINEPTGIRIENCTFEGGNKPGYAVLYQKVGNLTAVNNTISGFQGTMPDGNPSAGFLITPGRTATLVGNKISNCDNGILVQTRTSANTSINDIKISNTTTATIAGTALLANNELAAGSGSVVAINNVDGLFHPVVWYQAAADDVSAVSCMPTWSTDKSLTAGEIDETELTLSWIGVNDSDRIIGYRVYNGAELIATVVNTSFNVSDLLPDTTYRFRVEAGNTEDNWSLDGPIIDVVTLPNTPPLWPEGSQVNINKIGPNSVNLSWTPAVDKSGIRTYRIYVLNGANFENWTKPTCLSTEVLHLQPDTEYTLQVRAEDNMRLIGSEGPTVTVRTLAEPATNWTVGRNRLNVTNLKSTSLTLNWAPPSVATYPGHGVGMKEYKLFMNDVETAIFPFIGEYIPNGASSIYNVTGLHPGTTYTFKLEVLEDGLQWTTDGPSITVTTPEQSSQNGQLGQPVTLYLQGNEDWWQLISDVRRDADTWQDGNSIMEQCTISQGSILIADDAFTEARDYTILIRATGYPDCFVTQTMTASNGKSESSESSITPVYNITPLVDTTYSVGATPAGIKTMTVNTGISGFKFFSINVVSEKENIGDETAVFIHLRNGSQIGINATKADFDSVNNAKAGFNVIAGDVIKVFIVNDLTNAVVVNPVIFQ
jgi:hypothetical protein